MIKLTWKEFKEMIKHLRSVSDLLSKEYERYIELTTGINTGDCIGCGECVLEINPFNVNLLTGSSWGECLVCSEYQEFNIKKIINDKGGVNL